MARVKVKSSVSSSVRGGVSARNRAAASDGFSAQQMALILGMLLFVITVAIYIPAMGAGFIWDDDQEITQNPQLPLPAAEGLAKIWNPKKTSSADYFPLKTSMLWMEYHLWGFEQGPAGGFKDFKMLKFAGSEYHVVNILMHAIDVLLIWRLLLALEIPGAWLAALIFGIHPVNVESVAWISERKNTLSTFFYLLSLIAYVRFDKSKHWRWLFWSLLGFLAALLCKTAVVILPVVLLIMVWWRNRRLTLLDLVYTIPFFILSAVFSEITVYFQNKFAIGGEVIRIGGLWSRAAGAGMAVWFYLSKALFPYNVMEIYPRWEFEFPTWYMYIPGILVILVFAALAILVFKYKYRWACAPLCGFGYFFVCVLPTLGFFKMSYMRLTLVADHFTYLGIIGIIALVVGSASYYFDREDPSIRHVYYTCATFIALILSWESWNRAAVHYSEKTLWTDTLNRNPDTWQGHNHLGAALFMEQNYPEAYKHFQAAVRLKPENPEVHNNLGLALAQQGHQDEAIAQYYAAARIKDDDAAIRSNLANALLQNRRFEEAITEFRKTLQINPNEANVHCNLGFALFQTGHLDEAVTEFQATIDLLAKSHQTEGGLYTMAISNRDLARQKLAELDHAQQGEAVMKEALSAIAKNPNDAGAHCTLGAIYFQMGRIDDSVTELQKALSIDPNNKLASQNLDIVLKKRAELQKQSAPAPATTPAP